VLHEGALTLGDYWVRRGARAWFDLDPTFPALDAAAKAMAPLLGWSAGERHSQIDHCRALRHDALSNLRAEQPLGAETA
jgi:glycerol-3-phosphate dehydrogenase